MAPTGTIEGEVIALDDLKDARVAVTVRGIKQINVPFTFHNPSKDAILEYGPFPFGKSQIDKSLDGKLAVGVAVRIVGIVVDGVFQPDSVEQMSAKFG